MTMTARALRFFGLAATIAVSGAACQGDPKSEPMLPPIEITGDDLLDDFEDGDDSILNRGLRNGSWYVYADMMGSGSVMPPPNADVIPVNSPDGNGRFLVVKGSGFKEYVGFGFQFNKPLGATVPEKYNISAYKGIAFKAKGVGDWSVGIGIPAVLPPLDGGDCMEGPMPTCHNVHKKVFKLTGEWQQKQILFKDLAQDPSWGTKAAFDPAAVISVQFDAAVPGAQFEISLDDVGLFK